MRACGEVASRRLSALGFGSAKVALDGDDRIVADIPGASDIRSVRDVIAPERPAIAFRLVDQDVKDDDIRAGRVPDGVEIVAQRPSHLDRNPPPLALYRGTIVSGDRIVDAKAGQNPAIGSRTIVFRLDDRGREQFADFTRQNVGKRFAIVLDGVVVTAPFIESRISGGVGEIDGTFSEKEASRLAALLGSGLLPASWTISELKQVP